MNNTLRITLKALAACTILVVHLGSHAQPAAAQLVTLYDATQPLSISEQGWPLLASPFLNNSVTEAARPNGTQLDTTDPMTDRGGYFSLDPVLQVLKLEALPEINSALGISIRFELEVQHESHVEGEAGDSNSDGVADRAGFSVIAVNSQKRAIELSFWSDRVWAQDDAEDGMLNLFTQAESAELDTTMRRPYSLLLTGERYELFGDAGQSLLSGRLRDYAPFAGSIDPYETPNFLFFGDNTTRGESRVELGTIAVATHDFDADGVLSSADIDIWDATRLAQSSVPENLAHFDINADGALTDADRAIWLRDLANVGPGDTNFDGDFNSTDLILAFQAGEYEDDVSNNSTWATGDWNGDQEFDSGDVIISFQTGSYINLARAVPESQATGWLIGCGIAFGICVVRRPR